MKSLKNHLSLITALFTILLTLQIFLIVDRTITAYEENLGESYSIVVVADKEVDEESFKKIDKAIERVEPISTKEVIDRLQGQMQKKQLDLLTIALPNFYRIHLDHFPTPEEIEKLSSRLEKHPDITRAENFSQSHDTIYRLMLLFKWVVLIFAVAIAAVTSLLILKEMRIWQFQHTERMSIMAMFGAPVWLRSAVLFRLAIVDALIASVLAIVTFITAQNMGWGTAQLQELGLSVNAFALLSDGLRLLAVALTLSIMLAVMIVLGHKEEV
jgi:cell division transport system permease protein